MNFNLALNLKDLKYLDYIDNEGFLDLGRIDNKKNINNYLFEFLKTNFKKIKIERIYYGSEFCEFLSPSISELKNDLKKVKEKKIKFTFLTSYLTLNNEKIIKENLKYLNLLKDIDIEVVLNDYGLLNHFVLKKFKLKPVIGRLLLKIKNNPYDKKDIEPDLPNNLEVNLENIINNQKDFFNNIPVLDFFVKNLGKNISFETDKIDLIKNMNQDNLKKINLHLPWSYLTSGRNCLIANRKKKSFSFPVRKCNKECFSQYYLFEKDKDLIQYENTVYKSNLDTIKDLNISKYLNRLVLTLF